MSMPWREWRENLANWRRINTTWRLWEGTHPEHVRTRDADGARCDLREFQRDDLSRLVIVATHGGLDLDVEPARSIQDALSPTWAARVVDCKEAFRRLIGFLQRATLQTTISLADSIFKPEPPSRPRLVDVVARRPRCHSPRHPPTRETAPSHTNESSPLPFPLPGPALIPPPPLCWHGLYGALPAGA